MIKIIYIKNILNNYYRIDKYLYYYFLLKKKNISRKKIQDNINNGNVLLNNKVIKKKKHIKINDKIIFIYKKNFFKIKKKKYIYKNKNIILNIKYEDNDIIIINKQPGLTVHPGCGNYKNTLINGLKYYISLKKIKILNYSKYRIGLLHRLDKDTSGLLIVAKNIKSFNILNEQFKKKKIIKKYLALVWGIPKKKKDIIKNYIGRNKKNRIKMTVLKNDIKNGKYSITKYKILKVFNYFSLIECNLKTGRTHQIRVHLKYIGNPIFNDKLYGGNKIKYNYINRLYKKKYTNIIKYLFNVLPRQALHSYLLKFNHPITKKKITFISKLPKSFKKVIEYLKKNNF
ncbi:MAG: RluA family pseudouridine synthase [Candidatus Shikimatogenerans bostrichidophilus]|nr:MAG: RluA family pseudouridine synthase [Candidatus Shikimatogenerans bostrichidophilus]